jgi:hypothetical protein
MNEPALTEAVKTDLPSPKPNRRRRLAVRFAALVVAVSVLGAAYLFTRRPELVWWSSPLIGKTGLRVRALLPVDYKVTVSNYGSAVTDSDLSLHYSFIYSDHMPRILRRILAQHPDLPRVSILIFHSQTELPRHGEKGIYRRDELGRPHYANQIVLSHDGRTIAGLHYERTSLPAFNGTYRQICNSLRIE